MKTILVSIIVLLAALFPEVAAAADAPGPNQAVIIVRIRLDPPIPLDFYRATLGKARTIPITKSLWGFTDPDDCGVFVGIRSNATLLKKQFDHYTGPIKGFLRTTIQVPSDRRIEVGPFRVAIFGIESLAITIPARWSILVPEGARYVYLGTLVFSYAGYYYEFTGMTRIDDFDAAQAVITEVYGKEARLIRVNLQDIEKE